MVLGQGGTVLILEERCQGWEQIQGGFLCEFVEIWPGRPLVILNLVCMKNQEGDCGRPETNVTALGVTPPGNVVGPCSVDGSLGPDSGRLRHIGESTDRASRSETRQHQIRFSWGGMHGGTAEARRVGVQVINLFLHYSK